MIKEDKNVDFLTTGRQPSEKEFARISEWIKRDKEKQLKRKKSYLQKQLAKQSITAKGAIR